MKYNFLLIALLASVSSSLHAQQIRFDSDSLSRVFIKAHRQNKPVFVLFNPPPAAASLPRELQQARRESGLNEAAVVTALNQEFLNKELVFGSAEAAVMVRKYQVSRYPTYLYFHPDGTLLYRNSDNSSTAARYLHDLQEARRALADPQNLSYFEREFRGSNRTTDFLKQYIAKLRQLSQEVTPALLDAYVRQLPVRAFDEGAQVLFVLENGPVVGSVSYRLARLNQKLIDSLYRAMPLPQRMALNNATIRNTLAAAIRTKNRTLAMQGAEFARTTWSQDYARGARAYELNLLDFYRATNDTTAYLRQAVSFYERQNAAVSADSARKVVAAARAFREQQQRAQQQVLAIRQNRPNGQVSPPAILNSVINNEVAISSSPPGSFLIDLNNAAWAIYQTGTRHREYLLRAALWSKRTVSLSPAAYNHDTLAHLLYRLQFYQEAEAMQRQAVMLARQEKLNPSAYQQVLLKMQKRTL